MPHHVKVAPVRVHSFNAELDCHTSRVVGYRRVCSCGARTKAWASVGAARGALLTHR